MARIARRVLTLAVATALLAGFLTFAQGDPNVDKVQDFISMLNQGQWAKAFDKLDSNLGFQMKSADKLSSVWKNLVEKAGPFKEFRESKVEMLKSGPETFTVVTQVCKFDKGLMDIKVALDPMGRVADFRYASHKTEPKASADATASPDSPAPVSESNAQ